MTFLAVAGEYIVMLVGPELPADTTTMRGWVPSTLLLLSRT